MAESNKNARKTFSQTIRNVASRKSGDTILLKYLTNSRDYKIGQKQTIVSEHIVIGRDSSCEVRYDDKFHTVSRIHASISKQGDDWIVKNLSKSNPTLINGSPVLPENVTCPTLVVIPKHDHIVPPGSAMAIIDKLPDTETLTVDHGHIGMIAGKRSKETLFTPLSDWFSGYFK